MINTLYQKHIISIPDFSRQELELIVDTAQSIKQQPRPELLKNKVVASCFFEASTRTRLSFETAVQRLGGSVIGFADGANTSLGKKGETLVDSVKVISSYSDAFFMRHPQEGAARLASEFSSVPVINGGDGPNEHPTQALLDLFTIKRELQYNNKTFYKLHWLISLAAKMQCEREMTGLSNTHYGHWHSITTYTSRNIGTNTTP